VGISRLGIPENSWASPAKEFCELYSRILDQATIADLYRQADHRKEVSLKSLDFNEAMR
jgi:hypothetical protein